MIEMEGQGEMVVMLPHGQHWHSIHERQFHWGKADVLDCVGRVLPARETVGYEFAVGSPTCRKCLRGRE